MVEVCGVHGVDIAADLLQGKGKKRAYLASKVYTGLVSGIPLPGWWSEEFSTLHRRREKPVEFIKNFWRRVW